MQLSQLGLKPRPLDPQSHEFSVSPQCPMPNQFWLKQDLIASNYKALTNASNNSLIKHGENFKRFVFGTRWPTIRLHVEWILKKSIYTLIKTTCKGCLENLWTDNTTLILFLQLFQLFTYSQTGIKEGCNSFQHFSNSYTFKDKYNHCLTSDANSNKQIPNHW